MTRISLNAAMVLATVVSFVVSLAVNELLFPFTEAHRGINWIYLPAGVRLLSMLLFGEAGAIGLLIASWLVSFLYFFPDDFSRAFAGGIIAAAAPYMVYKTAQRLYGLQSSLVNLTPRRLLACICAYSLASPILHHLWFWSLGDKGLTYSGFWAMVAGDMGGTLIVVYTAKLLVVRLLPR